MGGPVLRACAHPWWCRFSVDEEGAGAGGWQALTCAFARWPSPGSDGDQAAGLHTRKRDTLSLRSTLVSFAELQERVVTVVTVLCAPLHLGVRPTKIV